MSRPLWRGLVAPAIATSVALAILIGLGVWQIERLAWKTDLIATIRARTTAPPVPLPPQSEWAGLKVDDYRYRHVVLTGTYENDKETHVFRPLSPEDSKGHFSGVGDLVLTPLRLATGGVVVINRGFVPENRIDPATRPEGQIGGPVTVTGLMREPESRTWFTPADDPATNHWFTRDPAAIAQHWGFADAAPFTIDADATAVPGGLPQGGETVLSSPTTHLSYAFTWFGLAIGLVGVFVAFAWHRLHPAPASVPRVRAGVDPSEKTG